MTGRPGSQSRIQAIIRTGDEYLCVSTLSCAVCGAARPTGGEPVTGWERRGRDFRTWSAGPNNKEISRVLCSSLALHGGGGHHDAGRPWTLIPLACCSW